MKRFIIFMAILCSTNIVFAQKAENEQRFHIGAGAGVVFPHSFGPSVDASKKDGYKISLGIGGQAGFDFSVPLYKGLFIKPAIYGAFTSEGQSKVTESHSSSHRVDTNTRKEYSVDIIQGSSEKKSINIWSVYIPVTIGYEFKLPHMFFISVGANGYVKSLIEGNNIYTKSSYKRVTPDKYGETKSSSSKDKYSLTDGISFKDRLDYGIGGQVGLRWKKVYMHYTTLYNMKDITKDSEKSDTNLFHSITFGYYFN